VHIHVAEDPVDERLTKERYGCGLLERFGLNGLMNVPAIFAHCTHLSEADIAYLNEARRVVAHNPRSNMNNAVGYAPARQFDNLMLGTDGIGADMWNESRAAFFKSNDAGRPLTASRVLGMQGMSARMASWHLKQQRPWGRNGWKVGMLEVGAAADLVLTCYRPATPMTSENLAWHFLFAMGPELVQDVMINGDWRLRNGTVVSCNEPEIRAHSQNVATELWQRMEGIH
jgi:cytosine/adenosine deaminase-related metal-dependent hydrolase